MVTPLGTANPRRTQKERREATRAALLDAAAALVRNQGRTRASLTEIAERAGVTKGAVQHHFTSKEDLFIAVVDSAWHDVVAQLRTLGEGSGPLEARVSHAVGTMWETYSTPMVEAAFIIGAMDDAANKHMTALDRTGGDEASDAWLELFAGEPVSEDRSLAIRDFARTQIVGLLTARRIAHGRRNRRPDAELGMLEYAVRALLVG